MKHVTNHLGFDGNCREAMTFYAKCLGAEFSGMTWGQSPMPCAPGQEVNNDRMMHCRLSKGGETLLMAADCPPGTPLQVGNNFTLSVGCDTVEEADRLFAALGEGGTPTMPLQETFFAQRFGMLKDRFGIHWMLVAAEKKVDVKATEHAAVR